MMEWSKRISRAVLVSASGGAGSELTDSSQELVSLAKVLNIEVTSVLTQRRSGRGGPRFLGEGKLCELTRIVQGQESAGARADCVLVDALLDPAQQRALEQAAELPVYDRTAIVLQVFARHARTRQAQLQVELARLQFQLPRLRDDSAKAGREGGGGRGERGHKNLVLEKQRCRARIAEVRQELARAERNFSVQRGRREGIPEVALIGYTNVGKSSLLRALTGSDVLIRDEPFSTLGTTVRRLARTAGGTILVSDTVGFMQGLPHELVAPFHATLESARHAQWLLIVADASSAIWPDQLRVTEEVLSQIGAQEVPRSYVFNKVDCLTLAQRESLQQMYPDALYVSAHRAADVERLRAHVLACLVESTGSASFTGVADAV